MILEKVSPLSQIVHLNVLVAENLERYYAPTSNVQDRRTASLLIREAGRMISRWSDVLLREAEKTP